MHRQEVFQPFKNHPRFNELIENIYTVFLLYLFFFGLLVCSVENVYLVLACSVCNVIILQVLDFFNSRMDMQQMEGEWSVDKVLQVIITNCRSWRGEGMKVSIFFYL